MLVTALVFGVLKMLGGVEFGDERKGNTKASSQDPMTRHDRGEKATDPSTQKLRQRARKLTSAEATEFLKTTIIPEINFENITLKDALKIVNEEIAKQTPGDQPKLRILFHPSFKARPKAAEGSDFINMHLRIIDEASLQNISTSSLLKFISDKTKTTYWFYRGDVYLDPTDCDWRSNNYYTQEKLGRVRLENIDASQLASKFNEIIENHDHFGPKTNVTILTTEKARAALLRGELQLPRINLDVENVTSMEALKIIAEKSDGVFMMEQFLYYNPFHEDSEGGNPFGSLILPEHGAVSFDVILDENILKPEADLLNREIPPSE